MPLRASTSTLLCLSCLAAVAAGLPEDVAFLSSKKSEKDVIALPSGLMYRVKIHGTGAFHPTADSPCNCEYTGKLIDGSTFDSGTASFEPRQVIKGWTEAMQLMVEGDKWELYIPSVRISFSGKQLFNGA